MPVPHDIYATDVDFTALALRYPDFAKRLKPNRQLDFTDPESVRQLTKSLLHRDFDINIDLPDDRLCPPVPNRFNYILFIQRLLDSTSSTFRETHDPTRRVVGLDIGTGSSAIYPLLATCQFPSWVFLATEIDAKSLSYARRNVSLNNLDGRIKLLDANSNERNTLIPTSQLEALGVDKIDIVMTNPPFYSSASEMAASAKMKARLPNSSCTGAPVEMIYPFSLPASSTLNSPTTTIPSTTNTTSLPGGEIAFVTQLILESCHPTNKRHVQWFSSMLGKLSSLSVIIEKLKEVGCTNYAVTEFVQGQKTRRWCVAWSWWAFRAEDVVARGMSGGGLEKKLLPGKTEVQFSVSVDVDVEEVSRRIDQEMRGLEEMGMQWQFKPKIRVGLGMSRKGDVWSRKARRKKKTKKTVDHDEDMRDAGTHVEDEEEDDQNDDDDDDDDDKEPTLVFKITIRPPDTHANGQSAAQTPHQAQVYIHIRWLQGHDAVVFESFCGWLKRKVTS